MYCEGPPGSQPLATRTGALGEERRRARPGPRGTDDVDPLSGHDRPGCSRPGEAGPDSRGVARHALEPFEQQLERGGRAVAFVRRAVPGPQVAADVGARLIGHGRRR